MEARCYEFFEMFDEYGVDNCKIELIENTPFNSKEEHMKIEGQHIECNDCINKKVAGRKWLNTKKTTKNTSITIVGRSVNVYAVVNTHIIIN